MKKNVSFVVADEYPGGYGSINLHGYRLLVRVNEDTKSRGANPGELRLLSYITPIISGCILPIPNVYLFNTENTHYFTFINADPKAEYLSPLAITVTTPIVDYPCQCTFLNVNAYGKRSTEIIGPIRSVEPLIEGSDAAYLVEDKDGKYYVLGVVK